MDPSHLYQGTHREDLSNLPLPPFPKSDCRPDCIQIHQYLSFTLNYWKLRYFWLLDMILDEDQVEMPRLQGASLVIPSRTYHKGFLSTFTVCKHHQSEIFISIHKNLQRNTVHLQLLGYSLSVNSQSPVGKAGKDAERRPSSAWDVGLLKDDFGVIPRALRALSAILCICASSLSFPLVFFRLFFLLLFTSLSAFFFVPFLSHGSDQIRSKNN